MYLALIVLMWVTPAAIAGALGWTGIWGTNSALVDYLVPFTVTGAFFHLPSFAVGVLVLRYLRTANPGSISAWPGAIAAAVMFSALALQVDFKELNLWLYTDYDPDGSPVEFEGTALFLFLANDAFWVFLYALARGALPGILQWAVVPVLPAAIVAVNVVGYQSQGVEPGHVFHYGYSMPAERERDQAWVYTSAAYDEALFRKWLEQSTTVRPPWESSTMQHLAVYFVDSMEGLNRRHYDSAEYVVATLCVYEEDRSVVAQEGRADCFSGRPTLVQRIVRLREENPTGLGADIDQWYANALLCAGVQLPRERDEVAIHATCRKFQARHLEFIDRIQAQFGADSEQARFVHEKSIALGLPTG